MTPARAEAERNTNTAAEGEKIIMTEEELEAEIKIVTETLEKLPVDKKPITREEKKEKGLFTMKKDVLLRIKDAREKGNKQAEFDNTVYYGVLNSWIGKHAFLRHLVISTKCRGNVF